MDRRKLAAQAVKSAMRLRTKYGIESNVPICPSDLALMMGIKVRFADTPTLEGMYSPAPTPAIILGTQRPAGRRAYTCAHEIGHHVFGHGSKIDELGSDGMQDGSAEEYLAQRFAAALLMPNLLINRILANLSIRAHELTPRTVYLVSRELGVGYTTLLTHLRSNSKLLTMNMAEELGAQALPSIREEILGQRTSGELFVIGRETTRATTDLEVGDKLLVLDRFEIDGRSLDDHGEYLEAVRPGVSNVIRPNRGEGHIIRVSRKHYVGDARYRFLEDPDYG